jgi:tetratricopeptide (TPR) repeat protein
MTPSEILISACHSIARQSGRESIETWIKASSLFCEVSSNPLADFISAEEVLNEDGQSAVTIASTIASTSFEWEQERRALSSILRLTNLTGLAALRFTAAWLAFNINDFEMCITECEKIDDHGYHVHGLMGQAFLESGQPAQAINCFQVALAMNEKDAAIWFQLAKATYVAGDLDNAWQSLESCAALNGSSAEIVILQCAVACATCEDKIPGAESRRENALQAIKQLYRRDPNKGLLLVYAARLAIFSGSEGTFIDEVGKFHEFSDDSTTLDASIVSTDISEVLKMLQKKGWYKGAACLLSVLTNERARSSGQTKDRPGDEEPGGPASA